MSRLAFVWLCCITQKNMIQIGDKVGYKSDSGTFNLSQLIITFVTHPPTLKHYIITCNHSPSERNGNNLLK